MNEEQLRYMREHGLTWKDAHDYPMSYDCWRVITYESTGVELPSLYPRDNGRLDEFEDRLSLMETKSPSVRRHELEQIKGNVANLRNKLTELLAEKKNKGKITISN